MKKIILFIFSLILFLSIQAQISERGTPVSFQYPDILEKNIPEAIMPSFDLEAMHAEDEKNDKRKDIPWRFGKNFPVNFNLKNSGLWENLEKGNRLWRLKITSENALSINIIFGEYVIPKGGKVFIYNENKSHILGAFTEKNNLPHRKLGIDQVLGNAIIVEYFEPREVAGIGLLMIEQVTHGYRGSPSFAKDFGSSGPCNNNVICPEGAPWQDQIRASAMNLVNGNTWCSGALINNTCQDGIPYYLTADHCLSGSVATWVFRFNYESPDCTPSGDGPYSFTVSGASLKANNGASDFALLELSSAPPDTFNAFYAGWDRSGTIPQYQTGIHHPAGDVKKISFDEEPAVDTSNFGINVWQITSWNDGTTEGGSSGSPLFDQNKRIIGQLYGGSASCSSLTDDNYGKFSASWDLGGAPSNQLKNWLDMCNTGEVFIDGYDPNQFNLAFDAATQSIGGISAIYCGEGLDSIFPFAVITNKGSDTLKKITIVFDLDGNPDSVIWTGILPSNDTTIIYFNPFFPSAGDHNFSVTVKNPNDTTDQKNLNDSKSVSFRFIYNSFQTIFTLKTDNFGTETSWQIQDTSGSIWYSGNGYSDITGGETIVDSFCFANGCYDFIINDSYGDGMSGFNGTGTQGTYYFLNEKGDTIARIDSVDFGTQEINSFCGGIDISILSAITCNGDCNGSLKAEPYFGTSPYTYQWSGNTGNQTTQVATGLCAGTYSVTISDEGSTYFEFITFTVLAPVSIILSGNDTEMDTCNGTISAAVSGGMPPFTFTWSNGQTTSSISELCKGTYFVTTTDSLGCTAIDSFVISEVVGLNQTPPDFRFRIFPNPNNGSFSVEFTSNPLFKQVTIFNILWEKVFYQELFYKTGTSKLNLETNLPSGIYFIKLDSESFSEMKKIIIARQ